MWTSVAGATPRQLGPPAGVSSGGRAAMVMTLGLLLLGVMLLTSDGDTLSWSTSGMGALSTVPDRCEGIACVERAVRPALTEEDAEAKRETDAYFSASPDDTSDIAKREEDDDGGGVGDGGRASVEIGTDDDETGATTDERGASASYDGTSANQEGNGKVDGGPPSRRFFTRPAQINYTWPERDEDYFALSRGTVSRAIFNDRGKNILKNRRVMDSYPTAVLSPDNKPTSGIHVITTFFHGSYSGERMSEIVATLAANLENPYVDYVHVLWEKENPAMYLTPYPDLLAKLVATEVKRQPTYAAMFRYANSALGRGSIAIITNADIYFTSSLRCLRGPDVSEEGDSDVAAAAATSSGAKETEGGGAGGAVKERRVYALSRRHTPLCGLNKADHGSYIDLCSSYVHSHDAFVFAPPVSQQIIAKTNHPQNRYGAENIVIWEFVAAGYKALNPCKRLHAVHLHCSSERHYAMTFIDGSNHGTGPLRHGTVWPGTIRHSTNRMGWKKGGKVECGARLL